MEYIVKHVSELYDAAQKDEAVIKILPGEYEINKTIKLRSNTKILGENALLKGSRRINLDENPKEGCLVKIDLKKYGIDKIPEFGEGPFEDFWDYYDIPKPHMNDSCQGIEFFYENKAMPISRYPKQGFMHIAKTFGETKTYFNDEENGSEEGILVSDDEAMRAWKNIEDVFLIGYWAWDWAPHRHSIKLMDQETGIFEVNKPYHCFGYRHGKCWSTEESGTFYAINVRDTISEPGEWCIDRKNSVLYVYPYENQNYIEISNCANMFESENTENIEISGLEILQCSKTAFFMNGCKNVSVHNCLIRNVGSWGVICENAENATISDNVVYSVGGGGIRVGGGDRQKLVSGRNVIKGNTVSDVAKWHRTFIAAVEIMGVGGLVSQNKIFDVPHFGILYSGNNHIIEKNEIKNASYESNDAGAVYSGRNYTHRGIVIRYNNIHDITGYKNKGCMGLYFDDCLSSAEVYGNVFSNIHHCAIMIGGGRDYKIHDNVFVNCQRSLLCDKRGITWGDTLRKRLCERLSEVDIKCDEWKNAYPELYSLEDNDMFAPLNNEIVDNLIIGGEGLVFEFEEVADSTKIKENKFIPTDNVSKMKDAYCKWTKIFENR